jgi:acyl dehydratase
MSINLELAGKVIDPIEHAYTWKDCIIYALGVGARLPDDLDFVFEGRGPRVLPTFAVVPSFRSLVDVCGRLGANPMSILHGEQKVIQHRPIPPSGTFTTRARVTGIHDKGKGALVVVEAETTDAGGERVFDNVFSVFVRGEGGFGGDRGPEAAKADPPEGQAPDFSMTETTSAEQAALYRLSGDLNPLHIAPEMARVGGFDRPILHGLCTYGHAGRAVLRHACGGDPARFRSLSARFSGVVFPGDSLTTSGWQIEPGRYVVRVTTGDGRTVLSNSVAEVEPA